MREQSPSEDEMWGALPDAAADRRRGQRALLVFAVILLLVLASISYAAMQGDEDHRDMPGMEMDNP